MIAKAIADFYQSHPQAQTLWVAYSGGVDSHVLLHALAKQQTSQILSVIHINHNLSPNADAWAQHCQNICCELGLVCHIEKVNLNTVKDSEEAAARAARYEVFSQYVAAGDILLTAHQENDQAETLLLQLLRGAGPKGLGAMQMMQDFADGQLIRPLLFIPRDEIMAYAIENQLNWVEDESNAKHDYQRNFLRHEIIPKLETRWPSAVRTIVRSAKLCANMSESFEAYLADDFESIRTELPEQIDINALMVFDKPKQLELLRYWLHSLGCYSPSMAQLLQIQDTVVYAKIDACPVLKLSEYHIHRYQDKLYFESANNLIDTADLILQWDISESLLLPEGLGELQANMTKGEGLVLPKGAIVEVRFRQGGERMQPVARQGSHPLKKLFQEWQVPPWQRERIPLIYYQDNLLAVVGLAYEDGYHAKADEPGYVISLNSPL